MNTFRKICLSAVFLLMAAVCHAYDAEVGGLYYNLDEAKKTASVTRPTASYNGYSGNIVIPGLITFNGTKYVVTSIENVAFKESNWLTSVTIPNSITSIGYKAFEKCSSLKELFISAGNNPLTLSYNDNGGLFSDCPLENLYLGRNLSYDTSNNHSSPFYNKTTLTSVTISNNVTSISEELFMGCSNLTSITIPNNVTSIGNSAFQNCKALTSIMVSNNVTSIGNSAFLCCSNLTSITIPDNVTSIGDFAFRDCTGLTSVVIPNSVTSMGNSAFYNCSGLASITIGNNVTSIEHNTFQGCSGLVSITIGNNVTSIEDSAFDGCSSLVSITIPSSVTSIGNYAFRDCIALKELVIADCDQPLKLGYNYSYEYSTGEGLFYDCPIETLYIGRNLSYNSDEICGYSPFYGISSLNTVLIGNSVTSIGNYLFNNCSNLTSIIVPDNITSIGDDAFDNTPFYDSFPNGIIYINNACYKYKGTMPSNANIVIKEGTTSIFPKAFYNCRNLASITIPYSVTSIGDNVFYGCSGLKELVIEDSDNTLIFGYNDNGSSISGSLSDCPLETLYLGRNLSYSKNSSISNYSPFKNKTTLMSITIGGYVTGINAYAFYGCSGLKSITIPSNVTAIANGVFNYCTGLNELIIADGDQVLKLGYKDTSYGLFYDCPLKKIYLGRNLSYNYSSSYGYSPFYEKKSLTSITIGNKVTNIGGYAFYGCTGLTSPIKLHDGIISVSSTAFNNVPAKLLVNKGTYTLLALWSAGIEPYQNGTLKQLTCPYISWSATQTTVKFKLMNTEEYADFAYYRGWGDSMELLESNEWTITDLNPAYSSIAYVTICKAVNDQTAACRIEKKYSTNAINPYIRYNTTASSISATGTYDKGDAEVVKHEIAFEKEAYSEGNTLVVTGLNPNSSYTMTYQITLKNGKTYSKEQIIRTGSLRLETEQPKVINMGNVIVKAKSNLNDAETNVGFEWRRTDWTDDFASNIGGAYLYEGEMEGYIRNLATTYLWKYRPYYVSDSGSRYYGEWVGIDPTNTSYFEPTVHTYDNVSVDGNTVKVRGYAQRGTDNITEQGFVYWKNNAAAAKGNGAKSASSVPGGAQTVTVKVSSSNPVIETIIAGLDYNTDYSYMAFVTTDEGTFYGEEQTFKTGSDPTGILDVTADTPQRSYPAGIYDLNGRKLENMQRGVNIVRFEDGTVKKIMVK